MPRTVSSTGSTHDSDTEVEPTGDGKSQPKPSPRKFLRRIKNSAATSNANAGARTQTSNNADNGKKHWTRFPDHSTTVASSDAAAKAKPQYSGWNMLLNPLWCYHGFRICVVVLTVFGIIMVFSSSAASNVASGLSPWATGLNQTLYCVIGWVLALIAMRVPYRLYGKFAWILLLASIILQLLIWTPLGVEVNGNRGWIGFAGITLQPAEVVKLALCIWLPQAMLYGAKQHNELTEQKWKAYVYPVGGYMLALVAVLTGKDLGTALIIIGIGVVGFLLGGFRIKWMVIAAGILVLIVLALVILSPNRMSRIMAAYQPCSAEDLQGVCYQATHAKYAIASGGLLGVGIGNSREKWSYLPEAHNDFIFAIIGEETGFVGAFTILLLFVILGWCMIVIALRAHNRYISMVLVLIAVWICGQAFINVGVVVGLLPVMGVPMPFVSAGGSSLVMCLLAAGVADSMMRAQPEIHAERSKL